MFFSRPKNIMYTAHRILVPVLPTIFKEEESIRCTNFTNSSLEKLSGCKLDQDKINRQTN